MTVFLVGLALCALAIFLTVRLLLEIRRDVREAESRVLDLRLPTDGVVHKFGVQGLRVFGKSAAYEERERSQR